MRCYASHVPTTKPRHAITETADVARALELAALKWPGDRHRPSRLILRLITEGGRAISPEVEQHRKRRREAIERLSGSLVYPDAYLEDLRDAWPA